jgi:peptidoglycan/LPS O-acetylase OafA/YrhL
MGQRSGRSRAKRERARLATLRRRASLQAAQAVQAVEAAKVVEATPASVAGTGDPARSAGFRPDIEGMRGVAVLLVVLFHAGIGGVAGGFIGVDVFFVISGFLITGLLLREREATGSVDLLRFYARRARRILPAAVVVIVFTLPVAVFLLDPLSRAPVVIDGLASALSIGNIRFALVAGDYFSTAGTSSPFLHFWSLGVEEQFYLVWPVLLILAGRSRRPRLGVGLVLGVVAVGSLIANLVVTDTAVNWAFYSLPTRAWQLALGGLLAVATLQPAPWFRWLSPRSAGAAKSKRSARSASSARSARWALRRAASAWQPGFLLAALGWLGLALVLWSALALDESIAYPGAYALIPTLGAAAMIAAGTSRFGPRLALGLPPLRFLGRISYSLYLWHWPLLVLPAVALGSGALGAGVVGAPGLAAVGTGGGAITSVLDWPVRVCLVAVSVVVATISCFAVEEPFRRSIALTTRPRRTLGLAFATLATVLVIGGVLAVEINDQLDGPVVADLGGSTTPAAAVLPNEAIDTTTADRIPIFEPVVVLSGSDGSTSGAGSSSPPAATSSPDAAPSAAARSAAATAAATFPLARSSSSGSGVALPAGVSPSLANAHDDKERLWVDGCLAYEGATSPRGCVYGDPAGKFTIALVGDSHGAHLFPAFERVAQLHHWRLLVFTKVSCPFMDIPILSNALKREYTECAAWNAAVISRLARARPNLTVVAISHWIYPLHSADGTVATESAALAREVGLIPGRAAIMVDTPHAASDVPDCLASHGADIRPCATPRSIAFSGHGLIERAAAKRAGVATIDLASDICPTPSNRPCPAVVAGMIVYRDYHHLTATFSASLAPALDQALSLVIGQP